MTPPIRPERRDRSAQIAAAQKAGYSLDEIAQWLDDNGEAQQAKELRGATEPTARNFGSQVAEGVMQGVGRPIMAAAGTAMQKLSGDDRPMGEIYGQLKDDVDLKSGAYVQRNPGKAFAGAMTGAVLSGKANPMQLKALGNATMLGRAGNASLNAGVSGGVASLLNTHENLRSLQGIKNAGTDAAKSAGASAALGLVASPLLDGIGAFGRGAYRMLPDGFRSTVASTVDDAATKVRTGAAKALSGGRPALPPAPATEVTARPTAKTPMLEQVRAVGRDLKTIPQWRQQLAEDLAPKGQVEIDPGAARFIAKAQKAGYTLADVEELSQRADGPDILAELLGDTGVKATDSARLLGNTAGEDIRRSLDARAFDEAPRWQAALERLSKTGIRDPEAYGKEVIKAAGEEAGPKYTATQGLQVPDSPAASLVRDIATLSKDGGPDIWGTARLADADFPKEPTDALTVGQLQRLRQVVDPLINYGSNPMNASSIEAKAQGRLMDLRGSIDRLAKSSGGASFEEADAITAAGYRKARAFEAGTKALRAKTLEELQRLAADSGDPDAFREGIASARQAEVQAMRDGGAGGVQNPYAPAMSSPQRRAITRAGLPDDASMAEADRLSESGANRMATRNRMAGSQTIERGLGVTEDAMGPINPQMAVEAVTNPKGMIGRGVEALWTGAGRKLLGDEMDAASKFYMAGGTPFVNRKGEVVEQMTREEAIKKLKAMEPALRAKWAQEVMVRSRVGAAAADAGSRKR
jgi:DNA-binding transcriptional MerR regulator